MISPATQAARSGYVAIVGRPNAGKSTLLNALIGQKISITSRRPQTTRQNISGIVTRAHAQLVFLDTPGFQTEFRSGLTQAMDRGLKAALAEAQAVLWLMDVTARELRDDVRPHPGTRGKCLLGLECFPEQRSRDGIVALRMSGDAHARDTGFLDDPRFEDVERSGEFTDGPRRVSGDQQDVLHTAGAQFRESRAQRPGIRHAPHRNVRRRQKTGAAHREGGMNHLRKARVRRMCNVNGSAGRQQAGKLG